MEEIIKSTLLEYEKSTFLIDIIKHHSEERFINIQQTIEGNGDKQVLKINPSILPDIISVLRMYEKEIANSSLKNSKSYFSVEKQNSIVEIYLKGISIKDLALQFDCSLQILEQIFYKQRN